MSRRGKTATRIFELVGSSPLTLSRAGSGWPAIGFLSGEKGKRGVAIHASVVTSHARRSYEYRFQNPADRAPVDDAGGMPLLVGLSDHPQPILVVVDGQSRVGRSKRFSILFNKNIIAEAISTGVSRYISGTGEIIYAIRPQLLPVITDLFAKSAEVAIEDLRQLTAASGFLDEETDAAVARARRATAVLARNYAFGKLVRAAYDHQCAMCGLGLNLVSGAHIYPVSAPGSQDKVWNGLALCGNHHAAFDNHDIWVCPDTLQICFSPRVLASAGSDRAVGRFVESTVTFLRKPTQQQQEPRADMFRRRYEYYKDSYAWVV